ncbi:MAG: GxxExxY protein [bacterium]
MSDVITDIFLHRLSKNKQVTQYQQLGRNCYAAFLCKNLYPPRLGNKESRTISCQRSPNHRLTLIGGLHSLCIGMINLQRELAMSIFYDDEQIGTRRVDFLEEDNVMVELKAVSRLEDVHLAQAINYLEAYHLEVDLLINFGAKSLEWKRVINSPDHR